MSRAFPRGPHGGSTHRALALALTLAGVVTVARAAPTSSDEVPYHCDAASCTLGVSVEGGLNVVDWDRYTEPADGSGLEPFGYDLHHTKAALPVPTYADNETRIKTGAMPGYTDSESRCGGYYHVRAYSKGRKKHSTVLSGAAPSCGSGDDTPPTVTIAVPASGAVLGAAQLFEGEASDDAGGTGIATVTVEVFADGAGEPTLIEPAALQPDGRWSLGAALGEGDYELRARATDGAGNDSVPATRAFGVAFPVDDEPPTVSIAAPSGGASLDLPAIASGSASDAGSGVVRVDIIIDDAAGATTDAGQATLAGGSWSYTVDGLADGDYTLAATAVDGANNVSSASVAFAVENVVVDVDPGPIVAGYLEPGRAVTACGPRDTALASFTGGTPPDWASEFDRTDVDFHELLAQDGWKSRYEWRQRDTDVVTNGESQSYLDALGYDAYYRDHWSPFRQVLDGGDGYLAILAERSATLSGDPAAPTPPLINGEPFDGQPYVSGVLTTYDSQPDLGPGTAGTLTVELSARMPRGQGVFPAFWTYPIDYGFGPRGSTRNNEFDLFEHIGQSPDCGATPSQAACASAGVPVDDWRLPPDPDACPGCPSWRNDNDSYATQYHNYHMPARGKLQNIGAVSGYGAVYTNADGATPWRGDTWAGCTVDFSEALHTYTLQWSAGRLAMYIDHVLVLEVDETADETWLPRIDFVPVTTEPMGLILNFALSTASTYIGAPDGFTRAAMDDKRLMLLVDYVRLWRH